MTLLQKAVLPLLGIILGFLFCSLCNAEASNINPDAPIASLVASAKAARARGAGNEALIYFDAAVLKDPSDYLTLFQRGATYLSLGKSSQANADFDSVLRIKPGFEGALIQRAKIKARVAEWTSAKADYLEAGKKASEDLIQLEEAEGASRLAYEAEKQSNWEECANQAGAAIIVAGGALSLRQLRARCRFEQGEIQMAISDLAHILQIHTSLVEPHLQISSMLFYSLGDTERGVAQMKKCLHSDPDSKPCKSLFREEKAFQKRIEKMSSLMESRTYNSAAKALVGTNTEDDPGLLSEIKTAIHSHREAGTIHPKAPSDLYTNLVSKTCEIYMSMNSLKKAKSYCTELLTLDSTALHGLLFQAQEQIDNENYDAAIATLNTAKDHHPDSSQTIQQKLQEAHTLLKRSKQKDYYKILGVSRDADDRTIKRAYRTATKTYHPDKAMARGGTTKEEAERKMAGINEAYEVLSDPELKARFDRGEDPNDPMARQGGNPFQGSPFGAGGGGQQFFFQQGGGGGQRQFKFSAGGGGGGGSPFGGFPGFNF